MLNCDLLLQLEEVTATGENMLIEQFLGIACQGVPVTWRCFFTEETHILAQELFEDIATFGVFLELFAIQVCQAAHVAGFGHDLCLAFHSGQHEVGAVIAAAAFELAHGAVHGCLLAGGIAPGEQVFLLHFGGQVEQLRVLAAQTVQVGIHLAPHGGGGQVLLIVPQHFDIVRPGSGELGEGFCDVAGGVVGFLGGTCADEIIAQNHGICSGGKLGIRGLGALVEQHGFMLDAA